MSADKVLVRQCNLFSVFSHDINSSICFSFVFVVVVFFFYRVADYAASMFPVQECRAFSLLLFF